MVSRHCETLQFSSSSKDLKFYVVKSNTNLSSQRCSCLNINAFRNTFFVIMLGVYIAEDHQQ